MNWFLYIIRTEKNRLYTGITTDVARRFSEHLFSNKGAKYFRSDRPVEIVYLEKLETRSLALKREAFVKKLSKEKKEDLIQSNSESLSLVQDSLSQSKNSIGISG